MATQPNVLPLLTQIQAALAGIAPNLTAASAGSDIFEAYVFSIVLDAAETEGATITFQNIDGSLPSVFTFRTSPGHIWSDAQPYTYAQLQFPDVPELEVHLGVYVSGRSGLIHEADVLVLLAEEAQMCRYNHVPPRSHRTLIATECKFYASNLQLGLGRAFVGLCSDLSSRECLFVTNSTSISIEKLLTHQRKKWESQLLPNQQIVVDRFRNSLQDAFKDFKTKYAA
jgi:hypothetical protein